MNSRLSKIRSVHTYVMPRTRTVYFVSHRGPILNSKFLNIIHYFAKALCLSQSGNLGVEMQRPSRFSSAVILTF